MRWTRQVKSSAKAGCPFIGLQPTYEDQAASVELLETGIKVVDLIMPIAKGGKIGLFGGAGGWKRPLRFWN